MTKYFVINVNTGERIEVLPHDGGNGAFGFADAKLAETEQWVTPDVVYTFANGVEDADQDGSIDNLGDFVNNDVAQLDLTGEWDIVKEEVAE